MAGYTQTFLNILIAMQGLILLTSGTHRQNFYYIYSYRKAFFNL